MRIQYTLWPMDMQLSLSTEYPLGLNATRLAGNIRKYYAWTSYSAECWRPLASNRGILNSQATNLQLNFFLSGPQSHLVSLASLRRII